jgi:hypothetical protein
MVKPHLLLLVLLIAALCGQAKGDPSFPPTGVTFTTSDAKLQALYDAAVTEEAANVLPFTPTMNILVEGAGYSSCWIETQPMGGEMYAQRNVPAALNNQLIFIQTQRSDGRYPGVVSRSKPAPSGTGADEGQAPVLSDKLSPGFATLQGFCFPDPAWRMYFWIGKDKTYLQKLYDSLAAYDAYLWRTRDSNGDGVLETWCTNDTGEDNSTRYTTRNAPRYWPYDTPPGSPGTPNPQDPTDYKKHWPDQSRKKIPPFPIDQVLVPFDSMDYMAYSYDARATLAKISRELNNGKEADWQQKAEEVRKTLAATLWNPGRHACFDHDKNGKPLEELVHNNLRAMYHGIFTQKMADEFINYHLLNSAEFWTPFPLTSIAIDSPLFENASGNNWSGQPEGLTYQRAIRALENYGHYSIVTLLGQKLTDALERCDNQFTQQYDPFTGAPANKRGGYGPTILATLEYISRMNGVHADLAAGRVWWSSCDDKEFTYAQRWGDDNWTLVSAKGEMTGSLNGHEVFHCTVGTRVVTDLDGNVIAVVGITSSPRKIDLHMAQQQHELTVAPDEVIKIDPSKPTGLAEPSL